MFGDSRIQLIAGNQHGGFVCHNHGAGVTFDQQDHAHYLSTTGTFGQQWLVSVWCISHGHQYAIFIVQPQFTDPPATGIFRDHLLGDHLVAAVGVNLQGIEHRPSFFIHQPGLAFAGQSGQAAAIADGHLGDLQLLAGCRGVSQQRFTLIGEQGAIFCCHVVALFCLSARSFRPFLYITYRLNPRRISPDQKPKNIPLSVPGRGAGDQAPSITSPVVR
ncbi:hypothetical protein D3C78_756350 [compost metagenome]